MQVVDRLYKSTDRDLQITAFVYKYDRPVSSAEIREQLVFVNQLNCT